MSTAILDIKEGIHWSMVGTPTQKGGRKISKYKCHLCNHIFKNHRNAPSHCLTCIASINKPKSQATIDSFVTHKTIETTPKESEVVVQPKEEETDETEIKYQIPLSKRDKAIVELICDLNIPYTQLQSPSWNNFVKSLDQTYDLPTSEEIRKKIIQYSDYICNHTLKDLKGLTVGLAVDGASLRKHHFYAFVLIASDKVRLLDIAQLKDQKSETIAKALLKCYQQCKKYNIKIVGVVSDNAASLKAAIAGSHPLHLPSLLGEAVIRVSCGAHTAQLVVGDVCKISNDFHVFVLELLDMVKFISNHDEAFKEVCPCKMPKYIATRWNTLHDVLDFVLSNKEQIDDFIRNTINAEEEQYNAKLEKYHTKVSNGKNAKMPELPQYPMQQSVPIYWNNYLDCLEAIKSFTSFIEGDMVMQYQLYDAYEKTVEKLTELSSRGEIEKFFCDLFISRFSSTANILIAKLAFIFTAEGLSSYRGGEMDDRENITSLLNEIAMEAFTEEEYAASFIIACFDEYIDEVDYPNRTANRFWKVMKEKTFQKPDLNGGNPISFEPLAKLAEVILHLPASEAIVERCFSAIKRLLNDYNGSMKLDLFIAQCKVKMAVRYKRKDKK